MSNPKVKLNQNKQIDVLHVQKQLNISSNKHFNFLATCKQTSQKHPFRAKIVPRNKYQKHNQKRTVENVAITKNLQYLT